MAKGDNYGWTFSWNDFSDGGRKRRIRNASVFRTKGEAQNFVKDARPYQNPNKRLRVVKATKKEYLSWLQYLR